jgi:hypothetical protein
MQLILQHPNIYIEFEQVDLKFKDNNIENVFYRKNNKSLGQTLFDNKYRSLETEFKDELFRYSNNKLGDFLKMLKESDNSKYKKFLNEHGDKRFCRFSLTSRGNCKGIYCFAVSNEIKYIGRCMNSFSKRINAGYGRISPKNCFIDGQATNCRINSLINSNSQNLTFGIYKMENSLEIVALEKKILSKVSLEWNIANN